MSDRTLVLLKPDAVERKLVGKIVARFEAKNLDVVAMDLAASAPKPSPSITRSTSARASTANSSSL